jgi:hypothetical protein
MLEVLPVSLFQMKDPYKFLIPESTYKVFLLDTVKFKYSKAVVDKARILRKYFQNITAGIDSFSGICPSPYILQTDDYISGAGSVQ